MTAVHDPANDAMFARAKRRMAATAAVNAGQFRVTDIPGGFTPGPIHGGALSNWRIVGADLRARLHTDAIGWHGRLSGGEAALPSEVEVLVPRYSADPPEAFEAATTLARLDAGGA